MVDTAKPAGDEKPLEQALEKTETVASDVQRASDDLAVVTTVLEQELPEDVQVGEVAQAIEHASTIEKKLARSAEILAEANAALIQEIKVRKSGTHDPGSTAKTQGSQGAASGGTPS